eukprot:6178239-Pleurochrysis_carterae.AAC.1
MEMTAHAHRQHSWRANRQQCHATGLPGVGFRANQANRERRSEGSTSQTAQVWNYDGCLHTAGSRRPAAKSSSAQSAGERMDKARLLPEQDGAPEALVVLAAALAKREAALDRVREPRLLVERLRANDDLLMLSSRFQTAARA